MAKFEKWLTDEGVSLLRGWARDGLTDAEIAHNCGVNRDTLQQWRKRFSVISDALKEAKQVVDIRVVDALYRKAIGFTHEEVIEDFNDAGVLTGRRVLTKQHPPDTTAIIYWLKNRMRDLWKDNHDRYEIEKERLQMEKQRAEIDLEGNQPQVIRVVMSEALKELVQ